MANSSSDLYEFKFSVPQEWNRNVCEKYYNYHEMYKFGHFVYCHIFNTRLVYVNQDGIDKGLNEAKQTYIENTNWKSIEAVKLGIIDALLYPMGLNDGDFQTAHISSGIEFTRVFIHTVVSRHNSGSDRYNILGLSADVWITTAFTILILSFCALIINRIQYGGSGNIKKDSVFNFVFALLANLLQNAQHDFGRRAPSLLVYGGWVLATNVLMKAFSGNLKSELMISKADYINSIEDILRKPKIMPAICTESSFFKISMEDESPLFVKLNDRMSGNGIYFDHIHHIEKEFYSGKIALFDALKISSSFLNSLPSNKVIYTGTEKYSFGSTHYFFNKRLPRHVLERIDYLSTRFFETSQQEPTHRLYVFETRTKTNFELSQTNKITVLTLGFLLPVFQIWLFGILTSIIAKTVEVALFFSKR